MSDKDLILTEEPQPSTPSGGSGSDGQTNPSKPNKEEQSGAKPEQGDKKR